MSILWLKNWLRTDKESGPIFKMSNMKHMYWSWIYNGLLVITVLKLFCMWIKNLHVLKLRIRPSSSYVHKVSNLMSNISPVKCKPTIKFVNSLCYNFVILYMCKKFLEVNFISKKYLDLLINKPFKFITCMCK